MSSIRLTRTTWPASSSPNTPAVGTRGGNAATPHVSPAIREHLVEQVVETAKHLRALALNGVDADSDVYLDTLARLGDVTQRLADFDNAQAVAS